VQWSATCRASRLQVVTHTFLSPSYMFFLTNDRHNLSSCRQQLEMWEHGWSLRVLMPHVCQCFKGFLRLHLSK
jgi:hypothetical protein